MATQTLLFNAGTGLTISCKLFTIGSDVVVATQTATELTNDLGRYSVTFTDLPARAYRMNGFVGAVGGFVNELYDLTLDTATFYPRSETLVPTAEQNATAVASELADDFALISGLVLSPSPTIERVLGDEDSIRFSWPVDGATVTGEVSKAGGAYAAVAGAITQRADEGDTHWYQLAYNAADRQLGSVRYKFTDGTYTRYVNLLVNPASAEVDESAIAGAVWVNATRGLTEEVTTDSASREASKADVSALALQTTLNDVLLDTGTTLPATLATIASYIDTEVAAIKAKTDNLPTDPATETTLAVLDGLIDAIKAVTDTLSLAAISTNVRTEMDTNSTKLASILEDTGTILPAAIDAIEGGGLDAAGVRAAIGLTSANLDTQLSTIDTVVDAILVDTGTTLPSTLTTIDGIADQILADTNELQLNQSNWLTADVSGLATQASVNAIDTVVDAILVDTNELQLNQGNWVTATGFSTLTTSDIRTAVGLGSANLDTQLGNIPTVAEFEARTLPSASYFDPATDTVARVTLVDTVTVNTDMVSVTGITTELAKVPKVGQTHRYSQVAVDAENKTADVTISATS